MWSRFSCVILVMLLMDEAVSKWGRGRGGWSWPGGRGRPPGGGGRPVGGRPGGFGRRPGGYGGRPWGYGGRPGGGRLPGGGGRPGGWIGRPGWGSPGGYGGFRPGTGLGSYSRGHSFRNAFLGAAAGAFGGMLAFEAGRAIIQSMTTPFSYGGRDYYFDNHPRMRQNQVQCSMPLEELKMFSGGAVRARRATSNATLPSAPSNTTLPSAPSDTTLPSSSQVASPNATTPAAPDTILDVLQYQNGTRPQVITWACRRDVEVCCGTECCPAKDDEGLSTVGIVIGVLAAVCLLLCCCGLGAYACNNGGFNGQRRPHVTRYSYPQDEPAPYYPSPYDYPGYPPQDYGPGPYPPYGYPPQYYPPEGYPPQYYPPEGYPPEGYPPQGYQPAGYPPYGYPPGAYPREDPPQGARPKRRQSRSRESAEQPKGQNIPREVIKSKENEQKPNVDGPKSKEK